jgi:arylformamidase
MARGGRPGGWIDVSVPLRSGMAHWPDNPPVSIERMLDMDRGDAANVMAMSLGAHTGTHMDAPVHFRPGAAGIDRMPIEASVGPARVIAIRDRTAIRADELRRARPRRGERLLFRTRNSPRAWKQPGFVEDFVYIADDAADLLAERRVLTVGVDYLSVGGYKAGNGEAVHGRLLGAGIWIIEGLDLSRVPPGPCELVCLPLKVVGGDGAPARAIVKPRRRRNG